VYVRRQDYRAAIAELSKSIQMKPDYMEAHFLLGTVYRRAGDAARSREEFELHQKLVAAEDARQRPHLDVKVNR